MASDRVNISVGVKADVSQLKKDLDKTFKSLNNMTKFNMDNFNMSPDLIKAADAAEELTYHLKAASNINTGALDLSKFNTSIKNAGKSLEDLLIDLSQGGSAGAAAFDQMTAAIARTQVPLKQTNALVQNMMTTLKNTAKWELSSTIVHGLEGALSGAVSYAKNLNTSLTNIRIVTGQTVDQMADFTRQANAAAKELSTTTKAYADASLIYYQQGDSQEMAAKKAAITIKAANASFNTTASEMSEYLTSVWNSYQVGADELERYVDIMAALGAKTATSLEEIATSMQKVAATGNTVGVSMEQVSSIIATVSSVTRESAESIGTSYKTIFARIGDLKLGKTDEDGIGLGQVSKSLQSIGVDILDSTGDLRDMGDVITDLGNKWQTMSTAQKTAIAQVVAGKRQYTQLMALFENWDMYKDNMNIAENSEGELEAMSEIYAESWEAASNRVRASIEGIFNSLIDDQGMIKMTNFTASIVDGVGAAIDSFGGLNGVLSLTGSFMMKAFSPQIGASIKNIGRSIKDLFVKQDPKKSYLAALGLDKNILEDKNSQQGDPKKQITAQVKLMEAKEKYLKQEQNMNILQKQGADVVLRGLEEQVNLVKQLEDEYTNMTTGIKETSAAALQLSQMQDIKDWFDGADKLRSLNTEDAFRVSGTAFDEQTTAFQKLQTIALAYKKSSEVTDLSGGLSGKVSDSNLSKLDKDNQVKQLQAAAEALSMSLKDTNFPESFIKQVDELAQLGPDDWGVVQVKALQQALQQVEKEGSISLEEIRQYFLALSNTADAATKNAIGKFLEKLSQEGANASEAVRELSEQWLKLSRTSDNFNKNMDDSNFKFEHISEGLFNLGSGALDLINEFNSLTRTVAAFGDESSTTAEKVGSVLSSLLSLGMAIPSITKGIQAIGTAMSSAALASGPWGWIIAAVAAVGAGIAGIVSGNKKAQQEQLQAEQNKREETTSTQVTKIEEETTSLQSLISEYSRLYNEYQNGADVQDQLASSAQALAQAYGLTGASVAAVTGNFEDFNKEVLKTFGMLSDGTLGEIGFTSQQQIANARETLENYQGIKTTEEWTATNVAGKGGQLSPFELATAAIQDLMYDQGEKPESASSPEEIWKWYSRYGEYSGYINQLLQQSEMEFYGYESGFEKFKAMAEMSYNRGDSGAISSILDTDTELQPYIQKYNVSSDETAVAQTKISGLKVDTSKIKDLDTNLLNNWNQGFIEWNNEWDAITQQQQYYKLESERTRAFDAMADLDVEDPMRKFLSAYVSQLNTILNDETISNAITGLEQGQINSFLSQYIAQHPNLPFVSQDSTIAEYLEQRDALIEEIAAGGAEQFPVLAQYEPNSDEYNNAVAEIADSILNNWTNLDSHIAIWKDISNKFNSEGLNAVRAEVEASGIKPEEIISTMIEVWQMLAQNEQALDAYRTEFANIDIAQEAHDKAIKNKGAATRAQEALSTDMAQEEAEQVRALWSDSERANELIAWDEFVALDFSAREAYLDSIVNKYAETEKTSLNNIATAQQTLLTQLKTNLFGEDNKLWEFYEQITREEGAAFQDFLNRNNYTYDSSKGVTNEKGEVISDWQTLYNTQKTEGQVDAQYALQGYEKTQALDSAQAAVDSANAAVDASELLGQTSETTAQKVDRYTSAVAELTNGYEEFAQTGKMSEQTMATLKQFGYNPNDIKNAQDYLNTMKLIINARNQAINQAKNEYSIANDGMAYDANESWTDEKMETEYDRYQSWKAIRDMEIETAQINKDTFDATISNGEAQISAMEARVNKLKEDAEKTKETAEILGSAIETGQLNQQQKTQLEINNFDLSAWNNAATAIERANIAAKQYSQYAIDIVNANKESEEFYSQASKFTLDREWYHNQNYGDSTVFDKVINNFMKYRNMSEETAAAWKQAYATMAEQTDNFAGMNNLQIFESVRGELERLGKDASDAGLMAAANAKDVMSEMFKGLADENAAAADAAVQAWESAFNRIADLRKQILSGENIQDDIFGQGIDNLLQAFLDSDKATYSEFSTAVKTGQYNPDLPTFDSIEQYWDSLGLGNFITSGSTNIKDMGKYYHDQGIAQGLSDDALYSYKQGMLQSDLSTLLGRYLGSDGTNATQKDAIITSFMTGDNESLYALNGEMVTAAALIDNAVSILSSTGEQMFTDMQAYAGIEETAAEIGARSLSRYMLTGSEGEAMTSVSGEIMSYDYISKVFDAIMRNHDAEAQSEISSTDKELLTGAGISLENLSNLTQAASSWGAEMEKMASRSYQDAFAMAGGAEKYGVDALTNKHYNLQTGTSDPIAEQLDVKLEELESVREKIADSIDEVQRSDFEDYNIDTKAWEELSDTIQDTAKASEELADSLANDAEAADEIAKDILRYDKAIKSIKDNYKDWMKTLEKGSLEDQADTVKELDRAYSDMLDLDYGILSKEFVKNEKNLKDMEEAAEGSEEAYNRLQQAAKEDIAISAGLDLDNFEDGFNELMSKYYEGQNLADMEIGASLDNREFLRGLSDMVNAAGLTAAQATSLLSSMGVDAEIIETPVEAEDEQTYTGMTAVIEDVGWSATLPIDGGIKSFSGTVPSVTYEPNPQTAVDQKKSTSFALKVTSANKSSGGGFKHSKGGGGGGSGGGGGGGQKKQKKEHKRPQDEKERYHRNNAAIKQVENELKKLTTVKDSAYGRNYVDAIDAETAALKREREEQEKLRQEAESYIKTDAAALIAAGAQIGENGVIENYDALIEQWVAEYNAAVDAWNDGAQEEADQEAFDAANQLYEDRLQMISDYEEALDTAADAEARLQEILNEISENTLEGITYTLELELEVNERDLELLEYYREQYEETLQDQDNLFANLMQQASEYETNFASLQAAYNDLMAEYNNGNGNLQADEYAEGLADLHSQILENLQNLQDIKEQIAEVYTNALDLAAEEIENATEALDHMNESMEAYIAIMGLAGRETDYATMQAFYDAQFATNMSNIEVQMAHLAALREQEEYFREKIEQDGELTELEEEQYRALMEQIRETESVVLDSTQTTLEVLQTGYENTINRIAQDLDEFMAGAAGSISHLQEQYAYFQEEQGRYVSTAKELYEVSSLNREIENTLAETASAASKEALKALQEKINKQSELNEMTEYDIEMNQLQYQLLLARIQLEEAQNSKDTVRLTRDDNGNYAYQYTADEDKVSEAMQKYEDTLQQMNDLTVERTSEIEQQMINSMAEYKEKIQEIAMDTTLSESEKYNRLLELQSQFDAEMAYLQEQAGIANENLLANQEAIADHYGVNITAITSSTAGNVNQTIQDMIANAQQYSIAMHDALFGPDGVSQSWSDYLAAVTTVQQASGTTVDDMLNNTANVGEVNEDAVQSALDAVEALTGTLEPINQMTEAWNAHQESLQGTIDSYEDLLVHINDLMAVLGQTDIDANLNPEGINIDADTQNNDGKDKKKPQYGKNYFDEITANSLEEAVAEAHADVLAEQMNHLVDHYLEVHEEVAKNDELTEWERYKQLEELQRNYEEEMEILRNNYKKQQGEYEEVLTDSGNAYDAWLDYIDTLTHINMLNNYHAPRLNNEAPVVIDQNVTIEAEFPNVSSTDEIIEAFNELINRAAQFASAKK